MAGNRITALLGMDKSLMGKQSSVHVCFEYYCWYKADTRKIWCCGV